MATRLNAKVLHFGCLGFAAVVGLCAVAIVNPGHVVSGAMRREVFYAGRPTSHWISEIQRSSRDGSSLHALAKPEARDVLIECLQSRDLSVRRSSAKLLVMQPATSRSFPAFAALLNDSDVLLRTYAILGLAKLHGRAAPAVPRLVALTGADDVAIRAHAQYALWEISPSTALTVEAWQDFRSPEFDFKVQMPGTVTREESVAPGKNGEVPITSFHASSAICHYVVAISPIESEVRAAVTDWHAWLEGLLQLRVQELGHELVLFSPIDRTGQVAFESIEKAVDAASDLEYEIRTHHYIRDELAYQIVVSYPAQDVLSNIAAEHFFASFELESRTAQ